MTASKAWRVAAALASSAVLALAVGCGGDDDDTSNGAANEGGDTGETITMWTRAATQTQSERLVEAYNSSRAQRDGGLACRRAIGFRRQENAQVRLARKRS